MLLIRLIFQTILSLTTLALHIESRYHRDLISTVPPLEFQRPDRRLTSLFSHLFIHFQ